MLCVCKVTRPTGLAQSKGSHRRFLPARRYASAVCDSDVSVCPDVCLSHAGIVPSRAKALQDRKVYTF